LRGLLVGLLLVFMSTWTSAWAQAGPSFDCAKASNAVERAICTAPALARADRDMAAAYEALAAKLDAAGRDRLAKDQVRWIVDRNRVCSDGAGMTDCLERRYASRTATLRAFAMAPVPAISQQSLAKEGVAGKIKWSYDIAYPQFDGTTVDFAAINAAFANAAKEAAVDATPGKDADSGREQEWTAVQSFTVYRPDANAVTVAVESYGYSGGAHGYGATECTLVDLRTGKAVGPQGVFGAGQPWLRVMGDIVGADLRKQFKEKPGFDDALEPAKLAKLLTAPGHYCWRADRLELIFNAYEVGPYVSGPFEVHVPYRRIESLLRADGPIRR